jgi:hypothetical protein
MRTYIAIDPGSKGFITIRHDNGLFEFIPIEGCNIHNLALKFQQLHISKDVFAVMEEVHAIFGSSAKATFAFGEINGLLKGLLIATGIPYQLVQPKTWQKEIWINQDMVVEHKKVVVKGVEQSRKEVNTKQTSFNAAKRLFPDIDLRKSERCRNWDDNKVDSLLLCEYARRKNL